MEHRTHPTQQDEALRQARLDPTVRDSLRAIADKLARIKPDNLMTEDQRLATALTAAHTAHPTGGTAADQLEIQLLRRMPYTDGRTVTRGEYALWLHKASWGA
ncbi:hypothetical protein AB0B30_32610 [Streptomyces narbonensis]|uniref:Uncharacterized protein n=1 Tax=Streptomyces narbonensis TaxID=67333 RepID=A0ABV3CIW4_9ACTN